MSFTNTSDRAAVTYNQRLVMYLSSPLFLSADVYLRLRVMLATSWDRHHYTCSCCNKHASNVILCDIIAMHKINTNIMKPDENGWNC